MKMTTEVHKPHPPKPGEHFNSLKATGLLNDSIQTYLHCVHQHIEFMEGQKSWVTSEKNFYRRIELLDYHTKQLDSINAAFRHDVWGIPKNCTVKTVEEAEPLPCERRKRKLSTLMINDDAFTNDDLDNNDDLELQRDLNRKDYELLNAMTATSELSKEISSLSSSGASDHDQEDNGWKRRKKASQAEENIKTPIDDQRMIPCVVNLQIERELNRLLEMSSLEESKRRHYSSASSHAHKFTHKCPSISPSRSAMEVLDDLEPISNAFHQSEPESDNKVADRVSLVNNVQSSNDYKVVEEAKEVIEDTGKNVTKTSEGRVGAWRLTDASDEEPTEEVDEEEQEELEFKDFDIDIVEEPIIKEEGELNTCEKERDDGVSKVELSVAGRRNIRTLLTDEKLTAATREAMLKERERMERLEQKRKMLDASQINETDRLVLDETEGSIIAVHPVLSKRLKEHQINGVKFMWNVCYESVDIMRTEPGAGCILAHCMGLGKTFQVVTLIDTLFSHSVTNTRHVLVVCPVSTVLNWQNEFDIGFTLANSKEDINVFIISDCQKNRLSKLKVLSQWWEENGVLIMGYDCYRILTEWSKREKNKSGFDETNLDIINAGLVNPGPDLVICDEGHQLKNSSTNCSKALKGINTLRRIILTGTPLQNNLLEYYSMVQFVKPDLLGTLKEFKNRFENPITNGQYGDSTLRDIQLMKKRSHVLHSILKDTVQRYEVTELQHYLPEKKEYVVLVKLHKVQAVLYQKYIDHFKANRKTQFLSHFHLLQSTWTHPKLLHTKDKMILDKKNKMDTIVIEDDDEEANALDLPLGWWKDYVPKDFHNNWDYGPKLKVMIAIVKQCVKHKQKVLIFSCSIPVLDLIEHVLKMVFVDWRLCRDFLRMDGTVAPEQRQKFCNMFNQSADDRNRVFLISQKVGGLGLNLVAANRVILMDVSWNPAIDTQSIFRVYRLGQTRPCYIYRLVSKDTMEEVVYKRSVTKQAISGRVVDDMQINRHYSLGDLREMYNFDYELNEERPTPKLPSDILLANVIQELKKEIFTYHEHESLLANMPEEELNPEDIKLAWDEFNREKESAKQQEIVTSVIEQQKPATSLNIEITPSNLKEDAPTNKSSNPVYRKGNLETPQESTVIARATTQSAATNLHLNLPRQPIAGNRFSRKNLTDNMAILQGTTSHTLILSNSSTSNGVAHIPQKPTIPLNIGIIHSDLKENALTNKTSKPVYCEGNLATPQESTITARATTQSAATNSQTHVRINPPRQPISGQSLQETTCHTLMLSDPSTSNSVVHNPQKPTTLLNIGTTRSDLKENSPTNKTSNPVYRQRNLATPQQSTARARATTQSAQNSQTHSCINPPRQPITGNATPNTELALKVARNTNMIAPLEASPYHFVERKVTIPKAEFLLLRKSLIKHENVAKNTATSRSDRTEITPAATSQTDKAEITAATMS